MAAKDYYSILGITEQEKNLQWDQFKDLCGSKYKKLALKWHPDRWVSGTEAEKRNAEDKFKEISEAYTVLSDKAKKQEYDMQTNGFSFSPFGFNPFAGFGFSSTNPFNGFNLNRKGTDCSVNIQITFEEAYNGVKKKITYNKGHKCEKCNGTGAKNGITTPCPKCGGSGIITDRRINGFMTIESSRQCDYCNGKGYIVSEKCPHCYGIGMKKDEQSFDIDIPAGILPNTCLSYEGYGNELMSGNSGVPGDLNVTIMISQNDYFSFDNNTPNIRHIEKINIFDSLIGTKREIRYPDGTTFTLDIPQCTHDKTEFLYKGKGFPILNTDKFGDYTVEIQFIYPEKLTNKQISILKNL